MSQGNVFVTNNGHRDLKLDPGTTLLATQSDSEGLSPLDAQDCDGRECNRVEAIIEMVFREGREE